MNTLHTWTDLLNYSNLGGYHSTENSNKILKYDISTFNPQWIEDPNVKLSVARRCHAVGVITKALADQLCHPLG